MTIAAFALGPPGPATAAPLTVDTFADTYDGSCLDGDCSLRDAVASAGAGGRVVLPSGFYALTAVEAGGAGDGSIDVTAAITIVGGGETGAFIDASGLGAPTFHVDGPGDLTLRGLTLFGARTRTGGPALWITGGRARLHDVTVTGGRGVRAGAVVMTSAGSLEIRDSLFLDNRSTRGAGAVWTGRDGGGLWARDTAFVDNLGDRGGAVNGRIEALSNVTIWGNEARDRGGALLLITTATLVNVTIADNRAEVGSAISMPSQADDETTATHTIIAGNRSERGGQCEGRLRSQGWNIESGTGCGFSASTDRRATDPRLGRLTSNGGATPTAALHPGSPALDIGGGCPGRDQRGAPRAGRCDAGAYERVLCRGRAVDIVGTPGDDELSGGREDDTFLGLGGADEFQGSLGRDYACAGPGDDHMLGGPGNDVLVGGPGADTLDGEDGTDRCAGGRGRDELIACEP